MDGNGVVCEDDLRAALLALGFVHLSDKQVASIFKRADKDANLELDFEVKEST